MTDTVNERKTVKPRSVIIVSKNLADESEMELPELTILSRQMKGEIVDRRISDIEVANPKCLNMPLQEFRRTLIGKTIKSVENRGKWLFIKLEKDLVLLLNTGMGADVIHFNPNDAMPEKYHVKLTLDDNSGFTMRVWWFCYLHLVPETNLNEHKLTARLGITPIDKAFTLNYFKKLLHGRRGSIKNLLLDQKQIAGIGNVYIQDILFDAKVHPKRRIESLSDKEITGLYNSMRANLDESIELGGLSYEKDFYGNKGGYGQRQFKIAYKPGQPCPNCSSTIQKIKTGSTSSFICPTCQVPNL